MNAPRFIMIGGFLGAGKTTTLSRLARRFEEQGQRVAIVTNDQATDLVDTNLLRAQGFDVGEVAGSCFCCNFNQLTATVEQLRETARPDVILAEPVGSCTDLVATVVRPLQQIYTQPFDIAPYGVIVKPSHGLRILSGSGGAGFSPQAEYIFRKQIEEADFVILNRIDELAPEALAELSRLIGRAFPNHPMVRISARTGVGFDLLCEFLDRRGTFGERRMEVDYDVYAAGEAELGWLNAQVRVSAAQPIDLNRFLQSLLERLRDDFARTGAETAHLKAIGIDESDVALANLTSSFEPPQLSLSSARRTCGADVVINARVAMEPDDLSAAVRQAVETVAVQCAASAKFSTVQCFKPGRPVPTHRLVS